MRASAVVKRQSILVPSALRRLCLSPQARWLGATSFSLYLVHGPVVLAVAKLMGAHAGLPVLFLVAVPLSLGLARAFHRCVEVPSVRLSRAAGTVGADSLSLRGTGAGHRWRRA